MPATPAHTVAIVGGGMAGASLALLLAARLPEHHILLIERHTLTPDLAQLALPSFDARATALACSTRDILHGLGLWETLQAHAEPILAVHVSEKNRPAGMLMRADEMQLPALGYVVENRHLGQALLQALQQHPRIRCLDNTHTQQLQFTPDHAVLHTDGGNIEAALVVVADGGESGLRQTLGIACTEEPYAQCALIANVVPEKPHQGVAYERFTDTGPVALLPLQSVGSQARAALVWTIPEADADTLLALPEDAFLLRVQERFGERVGKLCAAGARYTYPLILRQAREQVRSRVVLLGNAAHSLHPVAGQGFNLILRDCLALADTLSDAAQHGRDIGALPVLQHYVQHQHWDQQKTIAASDLLPRLFSSRTLPHTMLRTAALLGLDFLPGLRTRFAREATGLPT
jgi:2-polyprenyl-6-methoxyphenol 4-hydroxylase